MNGTIEDRYFEWLYSHVASVANRDPSHSYWSLARVLHSTEFTWSVRNDENRQHDGINLRREFVQEWGISRDEMFWMSLGCSMFEMLVGVSNRLAFLSDGFPGLPSSIGQWFWVLMKNLELSRHSDDLFEISIHEEVNEVLARVINRDYEPNGHGGLFPLRYPVCDQRRVELWDQMNAYLVERVE